MSVNTVTYDQAVPIRPGVDDMGGAAKENRLARPPDPVRAATAEDFNQITKQIVELAAVAPIARVTVKFVAGAPTIDSVTGMGSAAKNPLTYTLTDNGAGDTTISWPAGTFPSRTGDHVAWITGATAGMIAAETLTNSVRVRTLNSAAAATDLRFVVDIMGQ